jgi:hypothetical protein
MTGRLARWTGRLLLLPVLLSILAYLLAFLVLNTAPLRDRILARVNAALPGTIEVADLRWGPLPWVLRLDGVRILAGDDPVITVGSLTAEVDLEVLARSAYRALVRGGVFKLELSRVLLKDYSCTLTFEPDGHLRLVDAFSLPGPDEGPRPTATEEDQGGGFALAARVITARGGRFRIDFPQWGGAAEGIDLFGSFTLEDGQPAASVSSLNARGGEVRVGQDAQPLVFPFRALKVFGYRMDSHTQRFGTVRFESERAQVTAEGYLATDDPQRWSELKAHVEAPPWAPALRRWLGDLARPLCPVALDWRLEGPLSDPVMRVSLAALEADVPWVTGPVRVEPLEASLRLQEAGGTARTQRVALSGPGIPYLEVREARFGLAERDLEASLHLGPLLRDQLPLRLPPALSGYDGLRGDLHLSGGLPRDDACAPGLSVTAELALDPDARVGLAASWGQDRLDLQQLELKAGLGRLKAEGWLDLAARAFRLRSQGQVLSLGWLARQVKPGLPVAGSAAWDVDLEGPWQAPRGTLTLRGAELKLWEREVGRLEARAALREGRLELREAKADGPMGSLDLKGRAELGPELLPRSLDLDSLQLALRDISDLLPGAGVHGALRARGERLGLRVEDPVASFRGALDLEGWGLVVAGEPLGRLAVKLQREPGGPILVREASLSHRDRLLARAELSLDVARERLAGKLELGPLALSDLPWLDPPPFPLRATVAGTLELSGGLDDPGLSGEVHLTDWEAHPTPAVQATGASATLRVAGSLLSGLRLGCDDLLPGLRLDPHSSVGPGGYDLFLALDAFQPLALVPDASELPVAAHLTGTFRVSGSFDGTGPRWSVLGDVPPRGLALTLLDEEVPVWNNQGTVFGLTPTGLFVHGFMLRGRHVEIGLCGEMDVDGRLDADLGLSLDVDAIPFLREALTDRSGHLATRGVEGQASCLPDGWGLHLTGSLARPLVRGTLELDNLSLRPRGFPEPLVVAGRSQVIFEPRGAEQWVGVAADSPLRGSLEEGTFELAGEARLRDLRLVDGVLRLEGANLAYAVPGLVEFAANPRVEFRVRPASDTPYLLSGDVLFVSGLFHKDFDAVRDVGERFLTGVVGQKSAGYSRPIEEILPFLRSTSFDLRLHAQNFDLQSRLPFGEADLNLKFDLRLRGSWSDPELYDRVDLTPGGSVTYDVVNRNFEVTRGVVTFSGDLASPDLDVQARTEIEYLAESTAAATSANSQTESVREETVVLYVTIAGVPPDLRFELSSDHGEFDREDLQYLLLTGQPKNQGGQGGGLVGDVSMSLLTENLVKQLSSGFVAPFLDRVSLGFTAQGGVNADVMTRLGRQVQLKTRVMQEGADLRYSAGFSLRVSDRWSLEGRLKSIETKDYNNRTYEAKLRYRIPVEN